MSELGLISSTDSLIPLTQMTIQKLMLKHFRLDRRANFPAVFVIAVLILFGACYGLFTSSESKAFWQPKSVFELFAAVVGAAAAFVYFLYSKHHLDTQLFCSLFEKFNTRYDKLNEKLNAIISRPVDTALTLEQINTLYDYFNLCAEEHLFYEAGYIDEKVWNAWLRGMKYFASDEVILRLWMQELKSGSYYEFKLLFLDSVN